MCELLGLSNEEKIRTSALLTEFFSHACDNPHGWGAAVFEDSRPEIVKAPESAAESSEAAQTAERGFDADLLLAHIRYATKGSISMENTHPFVMKDLSGTEWVLAHNGTIFEGDVLSGYVRGQHGETDSERILMYFIDSMDSEIRRACSPLRTSDKARVLEKVLQDITPGNKVNLLISDGRSLYAHTNYRGSLHIIQQGGAVTISTKPLRSAAAGSWHELPLNTLMVFEKGKLTYRGVPHDNEYFEDEDKTRMLFLDYASM